MSGFAALSASRTDGFSSPFPATVGSGFNAGPGVIGFASANLHSTVYGWCLFEFPHRYLDSLHRLKKPLRRTHPARRSPNRIRNLGIDNFLREKPTGCKVGEFSPSRYFPRSPAEESPPILTVNARSGDQQTLRFKSRKCFRKCQTDFLTSARRVARLMRIGRRLPKFALELQSLRPESTINTRFSLSEPVRCDPRGLRSFFRTYLVTLSRTEPRVNLSA